mmetsp:Transcript_22585/g.42432  ORF Transcript_22585/g.42432 Transcript_22585/m.42432 type:complete len:102 (+) Transcript_22585:489-794(+)
MQPLSSAAEDAANDRPRFQNSTKKFPGEQHHALNHKLSASCSDRGSQKESKRVMGGGELLLRHLAASGSTATSSRAQRTDNRKRGSQHGTRGGGRAKRCWK